MPIVRTNLITAPASCNTIGSNDQRAIILGSRIRLNPRINVELYNFSDAGRLIAETLQTYGAIIVDVTNNNLLYAESKTNWNGILSEKEIELISLEEFEIIAPETALD